MVVCIFDDWNVQDENPKPVKGCIYTVREVYWCIFVRNVGLHFEELRMIRMAFDGSEPGFNSSCFRPVRRTDISVLRSLLVTPPKELVRG
jgi:hypothetical protein